MATRRESVILELKDQFSSPAIRAAASARLLQGSLDNTSHSADRVSPSMGRAEESISETGTTARRSGSDINQFSGRLGLLVQAATSVAPAFAPIGAVAVPALAGLSNAVGVSALAVGTGVLAFQGLADALKAMDKASLEPTTAHLEDARAKLEALSAPAKKFAEDIGAVMPILEQLRLAAGTDLFPGLSNLIDGGVSEFPRIQSLLEQVGGALGNLGTMTADSLKSGQWGDFLEFLSVEAPRSIESLGRSTASLVGGLSELWMAFQPTNNDFNSWLEDTAQQFQDWASGLSSTDGFTEFIDYIDKSGPQVAAALGSIANAVLQIGEAVAPLGGPTLEIISTLADALASIADSPLGAPLAALASMVSTLSLLNKGLTSASGLFGGFGGGAGSTGETAGIGAFFSDNADQVREAASTMQSSIAAMGPTIRQSLGRGLAPTTPQLASLRARMGEVGRAAGQMAGGVARSAAPMAGLALAATDVDEKLGISNAAMLGLTGSMAGPLGAAIGTSVGLLLDFKSAGEGATDALNGLDSAAGGGNLDLLSQKIRDAKKELTDYNDIAGGKFGIGNTLRRIGTDISNVGSGKFTDQTAEYQAQIDGAERAADSLRELNKIAAESAPAMQALGISFNDLSKAQSLAVVDPSQYAVLLGAIDQFQAGAGTARARADALAASMANMGNTMLPPAERAKQLKDALDALLSPQLNLADATDQYQDGLRNIGKSLDKANKSLQGNTDAASQNRDAVRTQVRNLQALVTAQADSGASGAKLAGTMRNGRKAILDAGEAAGISRGQMRKYLDTLGLTPKSITTIVNAQTQGAMAALNAIRAYKIPDKSFTVTQFTNSRLGDAKVTGGTKKASGGPIRGEGSATSDSIPIWASNGEFMIKASAVSHYGQGLFDALNAKRLATGGPVSGKRPNARPQRLGFLDLPEGYDGIPKGGFPALLKAMQGDLKGLRRGIKESEAAIDAQTDAVDLQKTATDNATQALEGLQGQFSTLASSIKGLFSSDLFAQSGDAFSSNSASDPIGVLMSDIANSQQFSSLFAGLQGRGLDGAALTAGAQGGTSALETLSAYTDAQLQQFEDLFNQREQLGASTGAQVAQAQYGQAVAAATVEAARQTAQLATANAQLATIQATLAAQQAQQAQTTKATEKVQDAVKDNGKAVAKGKRSRK